MSSHTDRINRMLLLWLDLQRAVRNAGGTAVVPWECTDAAVIQSWDQITQPQNERALEEWLYQSATGESESWAQQALLACRRRLRRNPPPGTT